MANKDNSFIISKHKSPLSFLTSGDGAGKIKFIDGGNSPKTVAQIDAANTVPTGIVIPLHGASIGNSFPDPAGAAMGHDGTNVLGDPAVGDYSLTASDFFAADGTEKNGGAQKFINAVLDSAYRGYTSGVSQGSGLSSMTVTRGDLSLSNTNITNGTGIVNTYSRSYTVNFKYYQSGVIQQGDNDTAARPDIANDNSDGVPF